jgi:hypothetical protein
VPNRCSGGSGIAPIRALLEDPPRGTVVVYGASTNDIVFQGGLKLLAQNRDAQIHYIVGARDDPGPLLAMTPKGMRNVVPDITRRDD